MSEWWTYRPSDFLMFSPRTYYRLFEIYNRALWPAQIAALIAGILLIVFLARPSPARGRTAAGILAGAWLWVGVAFHLGRYASIHTGAKYFAGACILEALLLLWLGVLRGTVVSERRTDVGDRIGIALVATAVVLLPCAGPVLGRDWHAMEIFGLAPDPTALATLGALLVVRWRSGWLLWIVPGVWCAFSGATLWAMGARDAWMLPLGAGVALGTAIVARSRARRTSGLASDEAGKSRPLQ